MAISPIHEAPPPLRRPRTRSSGHGSGRGRGRLRPRRAPVSGHGSVRCPRRKALGHRLEQPAPRGQGVASTMRSRCRCKPARR